MTAKNLTKELDMAFTLKPILCLDVDKTFRRNKDNHKGFINKPEDQELMPGMIERIAEFKRHGYLFAMVSNQGGLAHGIKTQLDLEKEVEYLYKLIEKMGYSGSDLIDAGYFCPFMENGKLEPYAHRSLCRKPDIGTLAILERDFFSNKQIVLDWNNSLMVGDSEEDSQMAANAHIAFYHVDAFLSIPLLDIVAQVQQDRK